MNLKEIKVILLVLFLFIVLSQVLESRDCTPAPTPTPSPTETPLLTLQLVRGD